MNFRGSQVVSPSVALLVLWIHRVILVFTAFTGATSTKPVDLGFRMLCWTMGSMVLTDQCHYIYITYTKNMVFLLFGL